MTPSAVDRLATSVMAAVVRSGAIRSADQDADIAIKIMREELKAFLFGPKYVNERDLALTGHQSLATASLVTTCIARILKERA